MTILKMIIAAIVLAFGGTALYIGFNVPAFLATPYILVSVLCALVSYFVARNLSNKQILGVSLASFVWVILVIMAHG